MSGPLLVLRGLVFVYALAACSAVDPGTEKACLDECSQIPDAEEANRCRATCPWRARPAGGKVGEE